MSRSEIPRQVAFNHRWKEPLPVSGLSQFNEETITLSLGTRRFTCLVDQRNDGSVLINHTDQAHRTCGHPESIPRVRFQRKKLSEWFVREDCVETTGQQRWQYGQQQESKQLRHVALPSRTMLSPTGASSFVAILDAVVRAGQSPLCIHLG